MPVTIGEFEVIAGPEPAAPKDSPKVDPKPALSERAFQELARRERARKLRTRAT